MTAMVFVGAWGAINTIPSGVVGSIGLMFFLILKAYSFV